jgi:integrase
MSHQKASTQISERSGSSSVRSYVASSLSVNTAKAYASDLAKFKAWGGVIPSTPKLLARYIAHGAASLKPSTLTRQLAAIAHAHNAKGLHSPTSSPLVRSTLRGIRRTHGCRQKQALPITPAMVHRLAKADPHYSQLQNARDRALFLLGFAGGFRRSELCALRLGDISITRGGAVVQLRGSKTDQYAKGRNVAIPHSVTSHCPVEALKRWIKLLRLQLETIGSNESADEFPLFSGIDKYGHLRRGLNAASVGSILLRRMRTCGLETAGYSSHSLRAGLVTSAAKAGVPIWAIRRQTGHRSDLTVQRYIRNLRPFDSNAATGLL